MNVLEIMQGLLPNVDPSLLELELALAGATINHIRGWEDSRPVEPRYLGLQIELAVSAFSKRGAEGQTAHHEGGINRSYGSSDIYPPELLSRITPRIRGVRTYENA